MLLPASIQEFISPLPPVFLWGWSPLSNETTETLALQPAFVSLKELPPFAPVVLAVPFERRLGETTAMSR